jgi:hypothetical protein
MSFRRRHRWFRRFALGLALLTAASAAIVPVAAAKGDDGPGNALYVSGLGLQSPPVVGEDVASKVPIGVANIAVAAAARPDDLAGRFAHSDAAPAPMRADDNAWTFERGDALILGVGTLMLALGLGLALGVIRRPRIAGL